ncbi:hypothetical protein [Ilyobacter polytropus]|uniref:Uncharacterized protein n=1 Tax=Ilyobacter polytropus (strain ATCC 51220 / DSM 2926 / LMG 16218 / CuHBu1) TaxID=572544 RepID=E3HDM6_ILYPC|nr:hypothetical protein [Ilyobacter polytropus]ADO84212.1 conserved hypothetical protein [Ilyobacter polytropus DSM 2926]
MKLDLKLKEAGFLKALLEREASRNRRDLRELDPVEDKFLYNITAEETESFDSIAKQIGDKLKKKNKSKFKSINFGKYICKSYF